MNNGGTGGCFSTIQAAVNASSPGDTINVAAGTYPELVNVNKRLTLRGARAGTDPRASSCSGVPATESVVTGNAGTTSFLVTASDVTIDGFTLQGQTNANQFGAGIVLGAGTAGAHVVNNKIHDNVVGLSLANNSASDQAVIQRNLICNNNQSGPSQGTGIYTDQFNSGGNLTNVLIDSNKFSGNTDAGIDFSSTNSNSQSNVTISNNEFDTNFRAMLMFNLTSSEISGNNIHNSNGASSADIRIFEGNSGLSISCNTIANGAGRGMRISNIGTGSGNSSNISANYNNISGNAVAGLAVDAGSYSGGAGSLNAENNWWGSATGPTIASNPGGTGDIISDPDGVVDYTPFATSLTSCPTTIVSPGNQNGWAFFDDNPPAGGGSGGFENGPGTPPLGIGSAFLQVNSTAREAVGTAVYAGTRLDNLGRLRYSSYQTNNTIVAISLQFDIDYDLTDASNAYEGRLVFEPYQIPATVLQGVWQNWDALGVGKWYGTRTTVTVGNSSVPNPCQQNTPCTWQQVLANFPNAGMRNPGALLFKAGGPWPPGFRGNVDAFKIGKGVNLTTFDFEPVP